MITYPPYSRTNPPHPKLLDKGVVAIPIHDSFIVEERHADATEAVMLQEFEALFGVTGVSVKRG